MGVRQNMKDVDMNVDLGSVPSFFSLFVGSPERSKRTQILRSLTSTSKGRSFKFSDFFGTIVKDKIGIL